jgi:peptidoglycan hydrolase CwlO-like protein
MASDIIEVERIAKLEAQVEGIKEDVADLKVDIKDLHSRITTGNREIMDKLDEKIDALARSDKEQHEALKQAMVSVKDRVEVLERWRWMIVGGAIVLGFLLNVIFKLF